MTSEKRLIESIRNLPNNEQKLLLPILEQLLKLAETQNEKNKRKKEFLNQFTAIVGIVFGVLATFSSIGDYLFADILYLTGILLCGISLILCLICQTQPIHNSNIALENQLQDLCDEVNKFAKDAEEKNTTNIQTAKPKNIYKKLRFTAYILFGMATICLLVRIILLFFLVY